MVSVDGGAGGAARAYLAKAAARGPAVVVLQEWWGLNSQIKGVCDRLAAAGFTALAPDLYRGRLALDEQEASHLLEGLDWDAACGRDVAGALSFLKREHPRVAVLGFCMGGALALLAGMRLADCAAVIPFYGVPPEEAGDPAAIKVPVQGHFAERDGWITPAAVAALEAALTRGRVPHELFSYPADHAFCNEESKAYEPVSAAQAWSRTLGFLKRLAT